jgi:glycosyltransferase involved in cell wall biosynthesis
MRLVMTLLVRDEADVVAAMIEHHLAAGVDFIVATDNGSTDGTAEILAAYERAGVLQLISEPSHTYEQAKWVTRMARLAAADHGADWVINADADEFWWPRDGGSLATSLEILPTAYGTVEAPRENLVGDPARAGDWASRLVLRDLLSLHQRGGRIGSKVCHRGDSSIEIAQGNHRVKGDLVGRRWPASPITVLHVPDRSYAQFAHKIAIGGASLADNPDLDPEFGWHWRADYARLLDGTLYDEWQARQPDRAQVAADLAAGRLVRDERLSRRLYDLAGAAVLPDRLAAALSGVML